MNYQGKHLTITLKNDPEASQTIWEFEIILAGRRVGYCSGNDGLFDKVCRQTADLGMMLYLKVPRCYQWAPGITTEQLDEAWQELREFVASYCGNHALQKYEGSRSKLVVVDTHHQAEGETNPLSRLPDDVWINTIYNSKGKGVVDVSYELTRHPNQHEALMVWEGDVAAIKKTKEALRRGVRSFKWVMRRVYHMDPAQGLRAVPNIGKVYGEHQAEIHRVLDIPLSIGDVNYDRVTRQANSAE